MTDSPRGLPLLSGPPPEPLLDARAEMSCRKCNKEFNILFARGRRCNHCGYSYCYSCSDYQALMPRRGNDAGYERMPVCAFCIQYLQITAGGKGFLRSLPLAKLKNYMQAYGLRLGADVLEKDDIINSIIAARTENGCLPKANENYYRKNSVPSGQTSRPRGMFSRPETVQARQYLDPRAGWSQAANFARPDLQPDQPAGSQYEATQQWNVQQERYQEQNVHNQYPPPPGPPPYATYTSPRHNASYNPNVSSTQPYPQYQRPSSVPQGRPPTSNAYLGAMPASTSNYRPNPASSPRPATAPPPQQPQPRPRVPTLDELLAMHEDEISRLSIGVLKDVLDNNHVRPGHVLEKSELIARVNALILNERRERVHAEAVREREAWEAEEREWTARERDRAARERAEEEERKRRRETYRTTVESASESDDSLPGQASISEPGASGQTRSASPSSNAEVRKDGDAMPVDSNPVDDSHSRPTSPSPSQRARSAVERSGLCVVCQDEDANIVVIDCGHLALCRGCSDLVWSSTRECPLCRTRIVTQARLLRVFKA